MKLKDFDFRIWDSNTNKFVEVLISDNIRAVPRNNDNNDNIEIELWSGFYDSKGTKIYEGDIVCIDSNEYIIGFDNSEFYLVNKEAYIQRDEEMVLGRVKDRMQISADIEVIGNIHENAELL